MINHSADLGYQLDMKIFEKEDLNLPQYNNKAYQVPNVAQIRKEVRQRKLTLLGSTQFQNQNPKPFKNEYISLSHQSHNRIRSLEQSAFSQRK